MTPAQREEPLKGTMADELIRAIAGIWSEHPDYSIKQTLDALNAMFPAEPQEPVAVTTKGHLAAMQTGYTRSIVARDPKFAAIGAMQDNDVLLYTNPPQRQAEPPNCRDFDAMLAEWEADPTKAALLAAGRAELAQRQSEPVQEPVATLHDDGCFTWKRDEFRRLYDRQRAGWRMDVYAHPPQRKPLTDEQIERMVDAWWGPKAGAAMDVCVGFARRIERAHGIGDES